MCFTDVFTLEHIGMRTLVFGMAFVTEKEANAMSASTAKDTSAAPTRDRARLLALQSDGYDIIVTSHTHIHCDCVFISLYMYWFGHWIGHNLTCDMNVNGGGGKQDM